MRSFVRGLADSISIMIGYLPLAFSFGMIASQAGLSPPMALFISLVLYAGASQFMLVSLLIGGAPALSIIVSVLLMNIRHIFYGPSLIPKLNQEHPCQQRLPRPLLAFGITDETYAVAIARLDNLKIPNRHHWFLGLETGAYLAWISGTFIGALFSDEVSTLSPVIRDILNFVLPALFLALLLEISKHVRKRVLIVAALTTAVLLLFLPNHLAMLAGMLCGASQGMSRKK